MLIQQCGLRETHNIGVLNSILDVIMIWHMCTCTHRLTGWNFLGLKLCILSTEVLYIVTSKLVIQILRPRERSLVQATCINSSHSLGKRLRQHLIQNPFMSGEESPIPGESLGMKLVHMDISLTNLLVIYYRYLRCSVESNRNLLIPGSFCNHRRLPRSP